MPFRDTMRAAGDTPSRHEYGLELTYADRIAPFLMLQPDLQIVGDPGGVAGAPAALITTLRITIEMPPLRR
ncbi:carbohydrate porin [Sphingobium sp. DEHP117]|nr:carbohydrate porin [Sphingobium sp. DEHP117]